MLRLAAFAALLGLAPAASAQAPLDVASRVTAGQRVLLVVGALGGGYLTAVTFPPAAPLGIAAATYGTGELLGLDGSARRVGLDAAIGTGVGYVAGMGMMGYFVYVEGLDADLSTSLASAAFGLTVGAVVTALRYDVRPATVVAPTGERASGLALRLAL